MKNTGKNEAQERKKIGELREIEVMDFNEAHNLQGGSRSCGGGGGTSRTEPTR